MNVTHLSLGFPHLGLSQWQKCVLQKIATIQANKKCVKHGMEMVPVEAITRGAAWKIPNVLFCFGPNHNSGREEVRARLRSP
jgi:hypothetical protein